MFYYFIKNSRYRLLSSYFIFIVGVCTMGSLGTIFYFLQKYEHVYNNNSVQYVCQQCIADKVKKNDETN